MARFKSWRVSVIGAEEIVKMLENMQEESEKILDTAASKAIDKVLESARQKCPVLTGKLKKSLEKIKEKTRRETRASYRITPKRCRYAMAVESGSTKRNIPAKPFLRPSLDENFSNIRRIINEEIVKGIDNAL